MAISIFINSLYIFYDKKDYSIFDLEKSYIMPKFFLTLLLMATLFDSLSQKNTAPKLGPWRVEMKHFSGILPFNFIVNPSKNQDKFNIKIQNGSEKFSLGDSFFRGDSLVIPFDLYDSEIVAFLTNSKKMNGYWIMKRDGKAIFRIPLEATSGSTERYTNLKPSKINVTGNWMADFWSDENTHSPGIGMFKQVGNSVTGTFLKPSGDYRFLQGNVSGDSLFMSYFDGSYCMQIRVKVKGKELSGNFYTGLAGKRNLKATLDPKASLPDLKKITYLKPGFDRIDFSLPDPDGNTISLQDARFKDKVVVIELMGSWCPNCIDESRFLAPYYKKNKSKGLEVIGLSFEYSDDMKISGPKIKNFIAKIGIPYPIVLAGKPDDSTIEKVLPMLHKINGYPTTFIIDKQGKVREIHTGFSGPGTGVYYTDWIQEFDKTIQALLIEKP
jgi:peroxiredoxin